jgi:hypothetical protein
MPSNREIVAEAFAAWVNGTGYGTSHRDAAVTRRR